MAASRIEEQNVLLVEEPHDKPFASLITFYVVIALVGILAFTLALVTLILVILHYPFYLSIIFLIAYLVLLGVLIVHSFASVFYRSFNMAAVGIWISVPSYVLCLCGGTCACFFIILVGIASSLCGMSDNDDSRSCDKSDDSEFAPIFWCLTVSIVAGGLAFIMWIVANGIAQCTYSNTTDQPVYVVPHYTPSLSTMTQIKTVQTV